MNNWGRVQNRFLPLKCKGESTVMTSLCVPISVCGSHFSTVKSYVASEIVASSGGEFFYFLKNLIALSCLSTFKRPDNHLSYDAGLN